MLARYVNCPEMKYSISMFLFEKNLYLEVVATSNSKDNYILRSDVVCSGLSCSSAINFDVVSRIILSAIFVVGAVSSDFVVP